MTAMADDAPEEPTGHPAVGTADSSAEGDSGKAEASAADEPHGQELDGADDPDADGTTDGVEHHDARAGAESPVPLDGRKKRRTKIPPASALTATSAPVEAVAARLATPHSPETEERVQRTDGPALSLPPIVARSPGVFESAASAAHERSSPTALLRASWPGTASSLCGTAASRVPGPMAGATRLFSEKALLATASQ